MARRLKLFLFRDMGKEAVTRATRKVHGRRGRYDDRDERLDLRASYAINARVGFYAEGRKLTDTKLIRHVGARRHAVVSGARLRVASGLGIDAPW